MFSSRIVAGALAVAPLLLLAIASPPPAALDANPFTPDGLNVVTQAAPVELADARAAHIALPLSGAGPVALHGGHGGLGG